MNTSAMQHTVFQDLVQQLPAHRRNRVQSRLSAHADRLQALFHKLYPSPDDSQYLRRLLEIMVQRIAQRSDELFALDESRSQQPGWFTTAQQMGYMAYADRLAGDLKGVRSRIPHLQSLGVTYLHLLPFLKARAGDNDGGFAVSSFTEINPALGNREDLQALTASLRAAGISLCSDIVLNHVADDHAWTLKARAGDPHYQRYFHLFKDRSQVQLREATLNQVFPETAPGNFTWIDDVQAWAWTTFYPYQWDLNYSNPAVLIEMVDAMLDLANLGIEAFRLDSAGYLWKQVGTACMNLPQTHDILQCMRACVDIAAPAVLMKAEAIVPTRDLPPYFGVSASPAPECHLAYHSSLMTAIWLSVAQQRSDLLARVMAGTPRLPHNCSWITYVRCHDDIGWNVLRPELLESGDLQTDRLRQAADFMNGQIPGSFASGAAFQAAGTQRVHGSNGMTASLLGLEKSDAEQTLARLNLVFGLICCVGGLPLIYMGDEWAQGNADNLPADAWAAEDGRRLQRPFWDEALANSPEHSIHQRQCRQIRAWAQLRAQHPQLAANESLSLIEVDDPRLLAFRRGDTLTILANLSEEDIQIDTDLQRQLDISIDELPAWGIRVESPS